MTCHYFVLSWHCFNFFFLFFSEINHDHHMCCSITRCHCNYFGYHSELMLHVIYEQKQNKNSAHKRWCGHFYSNGDQYRIVRRIYCMTFQWLVYQITCTEQWYPPHNMLIKKKKFQQKKWISEIVFRATIQGSFKWFSSTEQLCSDFIAEKKQELHQVDVWFYFSVG